MYNSGSANDILVCIFTALKNGQISAESALGRMGGSQRPLPPSERLLQRIIRRQFELQRIKLERISLRRSAERTGRRGSGNSVHSGRSDDALPPQERRSLLRRLRSDEQDEDQLTGEAAIFPPAVLLLPIRDVTISPI